MGGAAAFPGFLGGRSLPRAQVVMPCRLSWPGVDVVALIRNLSPAGVGLTLSEHTKLDMKERTRLHLLNKITLQVVPVHARQEPGELLAGFKVAAIEEGAQEWEALLHNEK